MQLLMAITVAALFAAGTYLILKPNLIRVVMGFGLYSNAANLAMIACGGYSIAAVAPFVKEGQTLGAPGSPQLMDPLPPDIILTAIVISFAVGALMLTIAYRVYLDHGTDNPEELPNLDEPDHENVTTAGYIPNAFHEIAHSNDSTPTEGGASVLPRGFDAAI
jgi:multicomponent Na+:H+ antiporter subunit C